MFASCEAPYFLFRVVHNREPDSLFRKDTEKQVIEKNKTWKKPKFKQVVSGLPELFGWSSSSSARDDDDDDEWWRWINRIVYLQYAWLKKQHPADSSGADGSRSRPRRMLSLKSTCCGTCVVEQIVEKI